MRKPGERVLARRIARALGLLPVVFALWLTADFARAQTATTWNVYRYNAGGNLKSAPALVVAGGIAGFNFTYSPVTALLTTTESSGSGQLLGNLNGKTISASVGVTVTSGSPTFDYFGQPDSCGVQPTVRLFFATDTNYQPSKVTSATETNFWWSNPVAVTLDALKSGDQTMSNALQPQLWSDANGHFGSEAAYTSAFAAAVKTVRQIGLSLGGGCFFDNGVGIVSGTGSASFRLMSYTAS